ncbi:MAG TPA: hypothetical protein VK183_02250, partial [Flavobacterium sp.]|nr:hypothetical protein [Flavobacterium sp.]
MKKLLVALAFFAVAGASAQTKAAQPKALTAQVPASNHDAKAQKNVDDLAAVVALAPNQKSDMKQLFINKFRMLTENGE